MAFSFHQALLDWYYKFGRHALPWQKPRTPYRVWLSEIMLQQTQVTTVIPYFNKFIARFPDIASLAAANIDEVLAHWAGLGYYSRARNLHRAAQIMVQEMGGEIPCDIALLQGLPGIGRSTAGAIIAQAFNRFGVIMDGNVKRVLCRFHAIHGDAAKKEINELLWQLAAEHTPQHDLVAYTQAIMDLGATVCTRQKPKCNQCPLMSVCKAYQNNQVALLPTRKTKKVLPTRERFFAIVRAGNQLLLTKQNFDQIWQGLWNLPNDENREQVLMGLGLHSQQGNALASFRHTFSHFHLIIKPLIFDIEQPITAAENGFWQWVAVDDLDQYALPAPIKKLVNHIVAL